MVDLAQGLQFVAQEDWLKQSLASAICLSPIRISYEVQRIFRLLLAGMPVLDCPMRPSAAGRRSAAPGAAVADLGAIDEARMREIYAFTARTLETQHPVPFGALIVNTKTGERLMRATNAVRRCDQAKLPEFDAILAAARCAAQGRT